MKTTQITKLKKDYDAKGTIMIPFKKYPNPFSKDDFNKLKMYCENVDKELREDFQFHDEIYQPC